MGPSVLDAEHGAEVVRHVDGPVATLDDLPVEPAGAALRIEVGVARVGVTVEHTGQRQLGGLVHRGLQYRGVPQDGG